MQSRIRITNVLVAALTFSLGLGMVATASAGQGGGSHRMHGASAPMRANVPNAREPRAPMDSHHANAPAHGPESMQHREADISSPHGHQGMQTDHPGNHAPDMEIRHGEATTSEPSADDLQPVDANPSPPSKAPEMPAGHHSSHGSAQAAQ